MTPPSAPPYSASMPPVLTWTSCRYSNTVSCRDLPLSRLLVITPSTVNVFSAPLAPLTWKPPSISPELTDGAVRAMPWKLRAFGMRSNSSAVTLCATAVLRRSICFSASAVTLTTSVTAPTLSLAGKSTVRPSRTSMSSACTFWNPCKLDRDAVASRLEIGMRIRAVGAADHGARRPTLLVGDGDRRARNGRLAGIGDDAGEAAESFLRTRRQTREYRHDRQQQAEFDESHRFVLQGSGLGGLMTAGTLTGVLS